MLQRGFFMVFLGIVAVAAAGAAGWQFVEKGRIANRLVEMNEDLVATRQRALQAESEVSVATESELVDAKTELGALRQQLSVAETAAKETEDRLAEEVTRRVAAEAKIKELADALDEAQKNATLSEGKAERALSDLAKIEAVAPASRMVSRKLVAEPAPADNSANGQTTASIDKADDATQAATVSGGQPAGETKPKTVRRAKKSKPKSEYFLDSLFN